MVGRFLIIVLLLSVSVCRSYAQTELQFSSIEKLVEQEIGRIVLPQIYATLDKKITITPFPANRAQALAVTGQFDGEIMRIWTYGVENPSTIRVPTPYYYLETMPFVLRESQIQISEQAQLSHYRVARVRGVKHTINITKGLDNVLVVSSTEDMFKLLQAGKIDVALTNTIDGLSIAKSMKADDIKPMSAPLVKLALYHYLHQKHVDLVPALDQQIQSLTQSGDLKIMIKNAEQQVLKRY